MNFQETRLGAICGVGGGMINYVLQLNIEATFFVKLLEAGATAFICGFLGVLGKTAYDRFHRKFFKSKKSKHEQ